MLLQFISVYVFAFQEVIEDNKLSSEEECESIPVATSPEHVVYLKYLLVYLVFWQFAFNISNAAIKGLLHFLRWFTTVVGQAFHSVTLQKLEVQYQ